jgi:triosephosphate isomerase
MRRPVFAANWKMNHGPSDAREFMRTFLAHYARHSDRDVILFPSAISLAAVVESLKDRHDIRVGVQNIHWEAKGAFTGELSGPMARDAGAQYALIGHSERRHVFGETDEEAGGKMGAAIRAGLIPMLCVGELLAQREAGETKAVVIRQLRAALEQVDRDKLAHLMVAYEPVWAIGTGRTATPADAAEVHEVIRREIREQLGDRSGGVHILYGGSVNRGNAAQLLAGPGIDGLLVGGASLDAEGWSSIVRA